MMSRTRMRGFSDENGSWKMNCMRRRMARSWPLFIAAMSAPSSRMRPAVGSVRRIRHLPVVDLPQPDSPTTAQGLAARHRQRHAVHGAQHLAALQREVLLQVGHLQHGGGGRRGDGGGKGGVVQVHRGSCSIVAAGAAWRAQHQTRWRSPLATSGGVSSAQRGRAWGQRAAKAQPRDSGVTTGTMPGSSARRALWSWPSTKSGSERISASV